MDHATIEEQGIIDRYVLGDLDPEEEARFEAHFFDCAACQQEVELAQSFRDGFRQAALEDLIRPAGRRLALLAWLEGRGRLFQGVVAAALLALIALPWALRLRDDPPPGKSPLTHTPVHLLSIARGDASPEVIDLATFEGPWILAIDVGDDPRFVSYRARIFDDRGRQRFEAADLVRNDLEVLMLTFPRDFFAAGDYRLDFAGVDRDGRAAEVGSLRFRVVAGD